MTPFKTFSICVSSPLSYACHANFSALARAAARAREERAPHDREGEALALQVDRRRRVVVGGGLAVHHRVARHGRRGGVRRAAALLALAAMCVVSRSSAQENSPARRAGALARLCGLEADQG